MSFVFLFLTARTSPLRGSLPAALRSFHSLHFVRQLHFTPCPNGLGFGLFVPSHFASFQASLSAPPAALKVATRVSSLQPKKTAIPTLFSQDSPPKKTFALPTKVYAQENLKNPRKPSTP